MLGRLFTFSFKVLLFLALVVAIVFKFGGAYAAAAAENHVNAFTQQRFDEFYALEPNSLDTVFIGSSHSYCTFDPAIIDPALGTRSWQLGTPSQTPDTTYYLLQEVLNYHDLDTVVMEVYWDVCDDSFQQKQWDVFSLAFRNDALKEQYEREVFPLNEQFKYNFDVIRYQPDYFAYQGAQMTKTVEATFGVSKPWTAPIEGVEYYQSRGYVYCDIVIPPDEFDRTNQFKHFDGKDWTMSDTSMMYLEKIIALCEDEGIDLLFVTAPVANVSMDYIQNYDVVHQTVADFATEHNVPYLDYNIVNMEEKLLENENFRDDAHLNHSGVTIVDNHFIDYMRSIK